jgi:hypothetical protein
MLVFLLLAFPAAVLADEEPEEPEISWEDWAKQQTPEEPCPDKGCPKEEQDNWNGL